MYITGSMLEIYHLPVKETFFPDDIWLILQKQLFAVQSIKPYKPSRLGQRASGDMAKDEI